MNLDVSRYDLFKVDTSQLPASAVLDSSSDPASPISATGGGRHRGLRDCVSVIDFGAVGDGNPEPATPFQNAYNYAATAGCDVYIPDAPGGSYLVQDTVGASTTVFNLARDNTGRARRMRIYGPGIIKLTATTPQAVGFNRQADYDTFHDHEIDLRVDCNNINANYSIVGTLAAGNFAQRINITDFDVKLQTWNVPSDAASTTYRRNIDFGVSHVASNEGTQTVLTRIRVHDSVLRGGNYGIFTGATCTGNQANVLYDEIVYERCWHDTGLASATLTGGTRSGANFFIGSAARGGFAKITDCRGIGSPDVGTEIDGAVQHAVKGTIIEDACGAMFFDRNFQTPLRANLQKRTYTDCHARIVHATPNANGFSNMTGWRVGHTATPTPALGRVTLNSCSFDSAATDMSDGQALTVGGPVAKVTLHDFDANADSIAKSLAGTQTMSFVNLTPASGTNFTLAGTLRTNVAGTITLNAQAFAYRDVWVQGTSAADITLDIDRHYSNIALTGQAAGSTYIVDCNPTGVLATRPTLRGRYRYVVESWTTSTDTGPYGANVSKYGTVQTPGAAQQWIIDGFLTFPDCDAGRFPSGSIGREIVVDGISTNGSQAPLGANSGNVPLVLYPRYKPATSNASSASSAVIPGRPQSTFVPGAATFTIGNQSGIAKYAWIQDAAVTVTSLSIRRRADGTASAVTSPSGGLTRLEPGDQLEYVCSGAPAQYALMPCHT